MQHLSAIFFCFSFFLRAIVFLSIVFEVFLMAECITDRTLGSVIKGKRERLGMSQRQLAKQTGLSNSTVSRFENDDYSGATPFALRKIAGILSVDYHYLLALSGFLEDDPDMRMLARVRQNIGQETFHALFCQIRQEYPGLFSSCGTDTDTSLF